MNELEWKDWLFITVVIIVFCSLIIGLFLLPEILGSQSRIEPIKPHMNPLGVELNFPFIKTIS